MGRSLQNGNKTDGGGIIFVKEHSIRRAASRQLISRVIRVTISIKRSGPALYVNKKFEVICDWNFVKKLTELCNEFARTCNQARISYFLGTENLCRV